MRVGITKTGTALACLTCIDTSYGEYNYRYGIGAQYKATDQVVVRLELERTADVGDSATIGESDIDYAGLTLTYGF